MAKCYACPRRCGADRRFERGYCGCGDEILVAKTMVHRFEEPPISGTRGSGAIFFGGCNLGCSYCQNFAISARAAGSVTSAEELGEIMLRLAGEGVHNIDLITAAHFLPYVLPVLEKVKPRLGVPIVYNSSGYESAESVRKLEGLVDIFLPDYKYFSSELAAKLSNAPDYPEVARAAIAEMARLQPTFETDGEGIAKRGVIIRHLVLPGQRRDSIDVVRSIAELFPSAAVSVMRQYTPEFNRSGDKTLDRRVTSFEYESVVSEAVKLGLNGFTQSSESASAAFTPDFGN